MPKLYIVSKCDLHVILEVQFSKFELHDSVYTSGPQPMAPLGSPILIYWQYHQLDFDYQTFENTKQ